MQTFKNLISPVSVEEFSNEIYNKKAIQIKGSKDKFSKLLTWETLNETLNTSSHDKSSFRMYQDGKPAPFKDSFDMIKNTQKGATLVVENIDRINNNLGNLHDAIENELGENTRSNLYLSFPTIKGFDFHYDTHDFIILQLFGKKRWKVYPTTIEQPLFFLKEHATNRPPEKSTLYLECVLEQGDILYVPKGHWHEVVAEGDELSVHLTLALFIRTGIDFLKWLTDELRELPLFRSAFPLTIIEKEKSHNKVNELREVLNKILLDKSTYDDFMQNRYATFKNRTSFNYPFHIFENKIENNSNKIFIKSNTPLHISFKEEQIILTAPKTLLTLPKSLKKAIDFIYNSENIEFQLEDIIKQVENIELAKKLTEQLIKEGLIRIKK